MTASSLTSYNPIVYRKKIYLINSTQDYKFISIIAADTFNKKDNFIAAPFYGSSNKYRNNYESIDNKKCGYDNYDYLYWWEAMSLELDSTAFEFDVFVEAPWFGQFLTADRSK